MWNSLLKLCELPPETNVYCAHEHTQTNLNFARAMDPDNEALEKRGEYIMERRQLNLPTVPSLLGDEIATNPFLRADVEEVQRAVKLDGSAPPAKVFGAPEKALRRLLISTVTL
jgi:hydroxyacylglutathione hydrolase